MILPSFYPIIGGAEGQAERLSRLLVSNGWSVNILTRRHIPGHKGLPTKDVINGITVYRLFSRGEGKIVPLFFFFACLWHLIIKGRGDIYHAHGVGTQAWVAVIASFLLGGKSLIKLRIGPYVYERVYASNLSAPQFRAILRYSHKIIVVNREVECWLKDQGVPSKRIAFIPNGVDVDEFFPVNTKKKHEFRRQLQISEDKSIILSVGRLVKRKCIDILLQSWALLSEQIRNRSILLIVGEGEERSTLEHMILSLNISGSVQLIGEREDIRPYYWAADAFVLPSRAEGLSNALLEAMACGLPVLASNIGGTTDLVVDQLCGYLFQPEDTQDLARKLAIFLDHKSLWFSMRKQSRQAVVKNANLDVTLRRLLDVYKNLFPKK